MTLIIIILAGQIILPPAKNAEEAHTHIVISFDGMRHDFTTKYMDEGLLPNFENVKDNGLFAEDIKTIFPSLTAASHAAISTGAKPNKTGMISNNLHQSGGKLTDKQSAFFSPLGATPIWSEAKKQGKTTATILFPGSNPEDGNQATYSIYYDETWAESALETLRFKSAKTWTNPPKSYSPLRDAAFQIKFQKDKEQTVYILAVDSTNNSMTDYDTFYVSVKKDANQATVVQADEWGIISLNRNNTAGFSFKLKELDKSLSKVKLYRTAVTSAAIEGPSNFKQDISEKFGFLPTQDDDHALAKKWITREDYEQISERFAKWTTDVSLYIKEKYKPDLLMFYYPQIDHEEHKYLLVDPRQPGYSKEKSHQYMNYIKWAYQLTDQSLGETLQAMNDNDLLFLASDHGMEPVHTMIAPNSELEKAGLLHKNEQGKIDTSKSKAYAVASGAIGHIYINLAGREQNGIVSEDEYPKVQNKIVKIFEKLKIKRLDIPKKETVRYLYSDWSDKVHSGEADFSDTASTWRGMFRVMVGIKENPFEDVITAGNKKGNVLDHERAGDVLLIAKQGYFIAQDDDETAKKAVDLGNHGGNPERKALRPVLFVTGNGLTQDNITSSISTIDIAPTLYELMGLKSPKFMDGTVIDEVINANLE